MDVEAILKEIRNRVVADGSNEANTIIETTSNGSAPQSHQSESLSRVSAHLAVTNRAWDRLPPVFSNRQGALARLELWLKRKSKPLTRWFTWEQINFNRAVKDSLVDVVEILKAEAHELATVRAQLTPQLRHADDQARDFKELQARLNQVDVELARLSNLIDENQRRHAELAGRHSLIENRSAGLNVELTSRHSALEAEHLKLANQVIDLAEQLRRDDRQIQSEQDRRLTELAAELKEEQRVCFRQVSLESSESAVLEDRARRELLTRLEKLEEAVKDLQRS
jgi:hypothetical protein